MATIVYDGVDGVVTEDLEDDALHYREEHWQIHHGGDTYTYVPRERVISVKMVDPHLRSE